MTDRAGGAPALPPAARVGGPAARVGGLAGWRRALAAFALGCLAVAAMPPVFFLPALIVAYGGLVLLLDGAAGRANGRARIIRAALDGWFFGFGFFALGLYWISASLFVDAARFAWLLPVSATGLPAMLALFFALATGGAALVWQPGSVSRVLFLAAAVALTEWLRGTILTGFPWNTPAAALLGWSEMAQVLALSGTHGAGVLVLAAATVPVTLLSRPGRASGWLVAAVILVWGAVWVHGWSHLATGRLDSSIPGPVVRIVQPSIPQAMKWDPDHRRAIVTAYLDLTRRPAGPLGPPAIVIWPESALPVYLDRSADLRAAVAEAAGGATLLTGMQRLEEDGASGWRAFNSVLSMRPDGVIDQVYDKLHLVPFGEYLPFQPMLEAVGIAQLTGRRGGFTPGTTAAPVTAPGAAPFWPLICYEIIFPSAVPADSGAGYILNVTNDAWFGHTAGPHQHLALARMRAIETGLPVVRAANTGISAVIDSRGRVMADMAMGVQGVLDIHLPPPGIQTAVSGRTNAVFAGMALALFLIAYLFYHTYRAS